MGWFFREHSFALALVILTLVNYQGCDSAKSRNWRGKYTQTSPNNRKEFKQILRLLRNRSRPKLHGVLLDWNLTGQLSAPRYMLNLYNNLKNDSLDDDSQAFNVTNVTTTKTVQGVDTIMGILNDMDDNFPTTSNFYMTFKFNFTAKMKANENVALAEFHIYKDSSQYSWMTNMSFVVQLYVVTVPHQLDSKLVERVVHGSETGWLIFDVTQTIDMWVESPKNNYGLRLSVTMLSNEASIQVDPSNFGFVGFKGPYQQRPFIVSFFKGDPTERSVILHASRRKRRSVFNPNTLRYGNNKAGAKIPKACRLRHLYVDFHALSWQNWIIAPDGYESSYCDGECTFPMLSPKNTTNHAIVQTLVHLLNRDSAPGACCAPTKLNAISVLYYDNNQNVILKKFKDMVVKSCGCH